LRLSIGGAAYYYNNSDNTSDYTYNEFLIGPYIRYYLPLSERLLFDISGVFQYYGWKSTGDAGRSNRMFFGGSGALTILLTNNLGLKGGIGALYSPNYSDPDGQVENTSYTQIVISIGFTAFI
jgi:hypothetical protein